MLTKLEDMGQFDNTIVVFTTDNGAEAITFPDGGVTPFKGQKGEAWEGGYRAPQVVRWPGHVKPGTVKNQLFAALDWLPTFVDIAGGPKGDDLKKEIEAGKYPGIVKTTLDGFDQRDLLAGKGPDKRREFFYWTDDGNFAGLRYDQYKAVFMEQPAHGLEVWMQPLVPLRAPKLFKLRSDPFERAEHEAGDYDKWFIEHLFVLVPAQAIVAQHLAAFQEFPPRQKPGSFSIDRAMDLLMNQKSRD